jgi:hypothetical protein
MTVPTGVAFGTDVRVPGRCGRPHAQDPRSLVLIDLNRDKRMKNVLVFLALSAATLATASPVIASDGMAERDRLLPGLRVTARFAPNTILEGQSTTFSWRAPGASFCEITGVPGIDFGGASGSLVLSPTTSLQANVFCEGVEDGAVGFGSASLTVQPGNTPPLVNASFSPASIYTGQSSTFSWSSQYATSCSSSGAVSVATTAGSSVLTPSSNQSVTVTCVGPGGQTSASANLTVSPPPPPAPVVFGSASPSWLNAPGWVWINWNSFNATSCSVGGPNGAYMRYFSWTSVEWIHCFGPGGTGSTAIWVHVSTFGVNGAAEAKTTATTAPDLRGLGLDLTAATVSHSRGDFNADGQDDLLVVDSAAREAHLLFGQAGRFPAINKTVSDVNRLQDVIGVQVPADGKTQNIVIQIAR